MRKITKFAIFWAEMFKDVERKCCDMIWGVVIILAFSALLALIIYLYQEHVEHLNYTIEMLRMNKDILGEELDNYKELVEDLDGYYDKWIETVAELDEANQKIYKLEGQLKDFSDWVNHTVEKYTV